MKFKVLFCIVFLEFVLKDCIFGVYLKNNGDFYIWINLLESVCIYFLVL